MNNPLRYTDPSGNWWEDPVTGALMPGYSPETLPDAWKGGRENYRGSGPIVRPSPAPEPEPLQPEFQFLASPVEGFTAVQGFGATMHAYNSCINACGEEKAKGCSYTWVRGLHNGLDLIVSNGTPIIWTGNMDGEVVDKWPGDGEPNIVVEAGGYQFVFSHISSKESFKIGDRISYGMQLGTTGAGHLHLGVRDDTRFYNPLYFFSPDIALTVEASANSYMEGENTWSIKWYTYSKGKCDRYYWGEIPDRDGIGR